MFILFFLFGFRCNPKKSIPTKENKSFMKGKYMERNLSTIDQKNHFNIQKHEQKINKEIKESYSGSCGTDVQFAFADETLTIKGSGKMDDYNKQSIPPWKPYKESIIKIEILNGVTYIGNFAFDECTELASVSISDSVTYIGLYSFGECYKLESITIPKGVTGIDAYCFYNCIMLSSIHIPTNLTYISHNAMHDCIKLATITVDSNNKIFKIVNGVLYSKDETKLVLYPAAKAGESYSILDGTQRIEYSAFHSNRELSTITIPPSVNFIGGYNFDKCLKLTSITVPYGVTSILYGTFLSCNELVYVSLPSTVTSFDHDAFHTCKKLATVDFYGTKSPSFKKYSIYYCPLLTSVNVPVAYTSDSFLNLSVNKILIPPPTPSQSPSMSPTYIFTKSDFFSLSNKFTQTQFFSFSSEFTKSRIFSISSEFTRTQIFSKSAKFTQSRIFLFTDEFTKSQIFSKSNEFTISNFFSLSYEFTKSYKFTQSHSFSPIDQLSKIVSLNSNSFHQLLSLSLSLTFFKKKSVSFSASYSMSISYYMSYDKIYETYTHILVSTDQQFILPYIIYYYSPSYSPIFFPLSFGTKKRISNEQLIGTICGSVAFLFLIIYISIMVYRCKHHKIQNISSSSLLSSENEEQSPIETVITTTTNITESLKDSNVDNWL